LGLRDLVAFLTALPVGAGSLEGAARWYWAAPLVGAVVGLFSAGAALLVWHLTGHSGAGAAAYIVVHVLLTGGLHLDGAADVGDLLLSGARGEEARRVMGDPRKGAGAVIAVATILIAQYSLSEALASRGAWTALALGHVYSYQAMYLASALYPPSPYRGLGRVFRDHGVTRVKVAGSLALTILLSLPALHYHSVAVLCEAVAAVLGGLAAALPPVRRLGYANGDVLGYTQEAARTLGLLGALACPL